MDFIGGTILGNNFEILKDEGVIKLIDINNRTTMSEYRL